MLITLDNLDSQKLVNDVVIRPLKINKDESGVLVETLRTDWGDVYKDRPFAMQYYSITPPFLARDESVWHYHPTYQDDRFTAVSGDIVVAVADWRKDSSTYGLLNLFYIESDDKPYLIVIPHQTLHGFMVVSDKPGILINFPTGLYNPKEEGRIPFAEAGIKIGDVAFNWQLVRDMFKNKAKSV